MEHLIIFKHVPINNFKHEDLFNEMKRKTKTFEHKKKCVKTKDDRVLILISIKASRVVYIFIGVLFFFMFLFYPFQLLFNFLIRTEWVFRCQLDKGFCVFFRCRG